MIKYMAFISLLLLLISCSGNEIKVEKTKDADPTSSGKNDSLKDSLPGKPDEQVQTKDLNSYEESLKLGNYLVEKNSVKDFITINGNCALIISPDEAQIEKLKAEMGEENFYVVADDNMWYQYEAGEYLEKKNVKVIHPDKRYLKFITGNKKEYYFDTRAIAGWTNVLFRPDSLPKLISSIGIEKECEQYFGK
jgi:hypothetical protein